MSCTNKCDLTDRHRQIPLPLHLTAMDLNNPATRTHRQDVPPPSGSSSYRVSTALLNLSGESTQETMLLRCERIETGLNELRGVLGSLRKTCTLLETQAEKLSSEITEMKDIVRHQYTHPAREVRDQFYISNRANSHVQSLLRGLAQSLEKRHPWNNSKA